MNRPACWNMSRTQNLLASHTEAVESFLTYAARLVRRGLICNTLGNIALRIEDERLPDNAGVLTKRRGVSLEEATADDLVVTSIEGRQLMYGDAPPSGGHVLNQRIFTRQSMSGTTAVIHSHPDIVIALFSQLNADEFNFISVDTALVLGCAPKIFDYGLNPEADIEHVADRDLESSCLIMPNHGLTTTGKTLSEAYHRHLSMVAEAQRIVSATLMASALGRPVRHTPSDDTRQLYAMGSSFIYGTDH